MKYFTRLLSILQGPSVDISNIYLTLLSHSPLVEQGALQKTLCREQTLWAVPATLMGNEMEEEALLSPLPFLLSLLSSPRPRASPILCFVPSYHQKLSCSLALKQDLKATNSAVLRV